MKLTQMFALCAAVTVCAVQAQTQTAQTEIPQSQTTQPKPTQSQTARTKAAQASPQQTTRPQVSDTALEDALSDKRFIQRQLKCALGEAPCDPIGKRLKTLAPLVLHGACPQCTPQETRQIQRTLSYVQRNYPQQWSKIIRQYAG